jgi:[ribosomal protein S5]-alanine N-acetyltransferase
LSVPPEEPAPAGGLARRQTARLILRRIEPGDTAAVASLHTDPANYPDGPPGPHTPDSAASLARMFVAAWERDGIGYWIVEHEGTMVGIAGITPTAAGDREVFNLYYRFVPDARGRGLAAEACREALAVAAELNGADVPGRPVIVRTRPGNEAAQRLARTLGLERRADLDSSDGFIAYLTPEAA